jgi:hypothetical protein
MDLKSHDDSDLALTQTQSSHRRNFEALIAGFRGSRPLSSYDGADITDGRLEGQRRFRWFEISRVASSAHRPGSIPAIEHRLLSLASRGSSVAGFFCCGPNAIRVFRKLQMAGCALSRFARTRQLADHEPSSRRRRHGPPSAPLGSAPLAFEAGLQRGASTWRASASPYRSGAHDAHVSNPMRDYLLILSVGTPCSTVSSGHPPR